MKHKWIWFSMFTFVSVLMLAGLVIPRNEIFLPLVIKGEAVTKTATITPTFGPVVTQVTPGPTLQPLITSTPRPANCSPAYPTVCIPPPPPDLDCGDIPYRRFKVLPPDPHRFDADGNGIGCESG